MINQINRRKFFCDPVKTQVLKDADTVNPRLFAVAPFCLSVFLPLRYYDLMPLRPYALMPFCSYALMPSIYEH